MICTIQNISKMLGGNIIFEELSLEIKTGDKLGVVGRNGSGKTTLFKLVSGIEQPDNGFIHYKKGTKIGYLAQIPSFGKETTGHDILYSAFQELKEMQEKMSELETMLANTENGEMEKLLYIYGDLQEKFAQRDGYVMDSEVEKVINGLQLKSFVGRSFEKLSGGEQTKIMLGKLLLTKPDLLLLDEPTNHLDLFAVEWLEDYLKDYPGTIVIVSHDRYFLDCVVMKIADLEEGELHLYHGNYSSFIKEKEERLMREFQDFEEQQKKIKKMKESIKRLRLWANEANPPNAGLHRQARNMERALERMEKVRKPLIDPKKMSLSFEAAPRSGKEVVVMENVSKAFGEQELLKGANLHVYWKDRTAIVGRNGSGKSTLLKILLGELPVDRGLSKLGSNVKVGFLSQHFEIINPKARLIDVFRDGVSVAEGDARHILAKFMFYGPDVFKRIADLSGGERMRLRLVQLMHQDINFLVLDEPTNHLDIDSREVLEEALEDFTGTIMAVSHDRYFLNKLFPRTAWLENGEIMTFEGPYNWAREKWQELQSRREIEVIEPTVKKPKPVKVGKVVTVNVEEEIAKLELDITALENESKAEPNWEKYDSLIKEVKDLKEKLDSYYELWMDETE
ncbi:ribosomal protection-like ABC-F family protein [Sporosarcina limicola]|uniref:ATPase subunit of ABC transporter with duplicated ATPase domains n=1 Tax=Sporosarcina limicola TaxID=34101 RepID=A0A927MJF0_9BACL|nr:ABC-F type ribosomal protection protein [Sporosarcina limicola]MBE1555785.1 ATPase subunit of ABC transporter with duplicated ATPase domains [Sporosarcina limicola]